MPWCIATLQVAYTRHQCLRWPNGYAPFHPPNLYLPYRYLQRVSSRPPGLPCCLSLRLLQRVSSRPARTTPRRINSQKLPRRINSQKFFIRRDSFRTFFCGRPVLRPGVYQYRCFFSHGPCPLGYGSPPRLLRPVPIPPGQPSRPRAYRSPTLFFPVGLSAPYTHFSGCPGGYPPVYVVASPTYRYTPPTVLLPQALGYPPCAPRPS